MILIPAGNPSSWTGPTGNNTYLLPGRIPTLVDAGVGHRDHIDAVARALDGDPLALVLITHGHPDHVGGVPALIARWPDVRIRQFGVGADPIVADEIVPAGSAAITVLHTPGHAPDHCCFVDGDEIFCGDLVRLGGTIVIPGSRGGNLTQYLESLRRVRALSPRRLWPGHGPVIDDPDSVIESYLRHRAERETQIFAALDAGCDTPERIVSRVYSGLSGSLEPAAIESVLAHLTKLQEEGRAVETLGRWRAAHAG